MPSDNPPVVHWFRRDFRLADNRALNAAAAAGGPVVPVYILSDWKKRHHWTGPKRQHFLCLSLASLSKDLDAMGGRLIFRQGEAVAELEKLLRESGASALYFNEDPDPFGKEVEKKVRALCERLGVECHPFHDHTLHAPDEILTGGGGPYRVFTPYSKNWLNQEKPQKKPGPKTLRTPHKLSSLPLPTVKVWSLDEPKGDLVAAGEHAAITRLDRLIETKITSYGKQRDLPADEATSRISQDLRFGLVSIRTVYAKCAEAMKHARGTSRTSIETFIKELAWREFYFAILHHYPDVLDHEFTPQWRGLPWDEPGDRFEAWKKGHTGFPIVDAGMRQLLHTGFMHNRVRMITAMFLTKDLHIDWKLGESWFLQNLIDGEIASNNGGWQWSAGTGADAAPYFRIQNPWSQTKRYDPKGDYIRKWVPELTHVPAQKLMQPPKDGQPIAEGYPLPIVDHQAERNRTLAIFKKHKNGRR
ncbi:deoxyribodipyrimidine photo-lyase [Luteolibacter ambystomatis]|uniref:Deoxyribodipyrimidine photo-lyase n=1 Tax=Luteolibacter ambystomatis TaxID=2824561 RepID=A0A975J0N5_9BACT|nr:deoxyribodipyrimidine photo-lyase [Luteolibacter ambystomatis]QUE51862.1 deoxyribodipyrimidine photo-lyase [Luteolibacter ambystomatis]